MTAESNTNRYEGLNLPDLMELMHGVIYPEPVSLMPETIGWQLLGIWFLVCAALILASMIRKYRADRYRREAIQLVDRVFENQVTSQNHSAAQQIATLVKRTAIAAFPRTEVASLTGDDWQAFLLRTAGNNLDQDEAALLAKAAYDPHTSINEVRYSAVRWIRLHRA